jgi:hypothetical protein
MVILYFILLFYDAVSTDIMEEQIHMIWLLRLMGEVYVTVQVFGNDSNKSKFDWGGNQEEIEFW